jgi:hypothetical protein
MSQVLGHYFKSDKLTSFIRQLDLYGFKKEKVNKTVLRFSHPFFKRNEKDELEFITRSPQHHFRHKDEQNHVQVDILVKKLENLLTIRGVKGEELEKDIKLIKYIGSYKNYYGKNIPIFKQNLVSLLASDFSIISVILMTLLDKLKIEMSVLNDKGLIGEERMSKSFKTGKLFQELMNALIEFFKAKYDGTGKRSPVFVEREMDEEDGKGEKRVGGNIDKTHKQPFGLFGSLKSFSHSPISSDRFINRVLEIDETSIRFCSPVKDNFPRTEIEFKEFYY